MRVTYGMLAKIYENYNPLGEKHSFLVDDFLIWSQKEGEFYWIWGGAVELAEGIFDPKIIIKELPFIEASSDYRDMLVEVWLRFLNSDEKLVKTIEEEYKYLQSLPYKCRRYDQKNNV
jgi:hypothetical protein